MSVSYEVKQKAMAFLLTVRPEPTRLRGDEVRMADVNLQIAMQTPAAVEAKHEHGPLVNAASKAITTPHVTRALVSSEPGFGTPPSRTAPHSG